MACSVAYTLEDARPPWKIFWSHVGASSRQGGKASLGSRRVSKGLEVQSFVHHTILNITSAVFGHLEED